MPKRLTPGTHKPKALNNIAKCNGHVVLFAKQEAKSPGHKFLLEIFRKDVFAMTLEMLLELLVLQRILPKLESNLAIYQRRAINALLQVLLAKGVIHYTIEYQANPYHPLLCAEYPVAQEYPLATASDVVQMETDGSRLLVASRRVTGKGVLSGFSNAVLSALTIIFIRYFISLCTNEKEDDPTADEQYNSIIYGLMTLLVSHGFDVFFKGVANCCTFFSRGAGSETDSEDGSEGYDRLFNADDSATYPLLSVSDDDEDEDDFNPRAPS